MNQKIQQSIESSSNYETLFSLLQSVNEDNLAEITKQAKEMLSDETYTLKDELPPTAADLSERSLAGRYLWDDGVRSTGLNDTTQKQGVILDTLDKIQTQHAEVFKTLKYWQESLKAKSEETLLGNLAKETFVLYVPKFAVVSKEMLLDIVLSEARRNAFMRFWIYLEAGAQAVFTINLRSRSAEDENFYTGCLQVYVGDGAHLILNEVQDFHQRVYVTATKSITTGKVSNLQWNICELGSTKLQNYSRLDLKGEGANALVYGLYFANQNQNISLRTEQNHLAPNTTSNLYYKGAVKDSAFASWQGMIYVDPIAKRTDGYQKNENLMISPDARIFSKPGLEIVTDDVKCSHGTTVTDFDADQIFYLMSRGMSENEAKLLILQGYFDAILNNITYDPIREKLQEKIYFKMKPLGFN